MIDEKLIAYLEEFVTDERKELFNRILNERTRYVTVGLEDIFQAQNASAVLRTCDCFGVQDVHIVENENEYQVNPDVALGSSKWVTMHRYNTKENNTADAIRSLKNEGYRIVATTPHTNDVDLEDFDIAAGRFALFFGTELTGLSDEVLGLADEYLKIPMHGFTESFNISVSAAIILNRLSSKLRESDLNWGLTESEKKELKLDWLSKTIKSYEAIEKEYYKRKL